jgi:hypothetical protein
MMRLIPWSVVLALVTAGCSVPSLEELENESTISVKIIYDPSFNKAGCIVMVADDGQGKSFRREFSVNESRSPLNVSIRRQDDTWSQSVTVTVTAHERLCSAPPLTAPRTRAFDFNTAGPQSADFDLTAFTQDVDQDGYVATVQGGTGSDCNDGQGNIHPGAAEACDGVDNNCKDGADEGLPLRTFYRDGDRDTYGNPDQAVERCASPGPEYVDNNLDCDDERPEVRPGAEEKCNGRDDNCANGADELFRAGSQPLEMSCFNETCGGVFICDPNDDSRTTCNAPTPLNHYADVDGDGEGAAGTVQNACDGNVPIGRVTNADDCDDAEPTTKKLGATEVCDAIDNNCSGQADEGLSCGGTFRRVYQAVLGDAGHDWQTVAVGPNGLPVWVAGLGGKLAVRKTRGGPFQGFSYGAGPPADPAEANNCGDHDWHAAWVNPANGDVFLAGENLRIAEHDGTSCIRNVSVTVGGGTNQPYTSIVGIGNPLTLFLVSQEGRLHMWEIGTAGANPVQLHNSAGYYRDVYALSPQLLYAVGTVDETAPLDPVIYEHTSANWNSPVAVPFTGIAGYNGSLQAIWMGSASQAYAVGNDGLVMRKEGSTPTWARVPAPPGATPDFSSVGMPPGSDTAYIVDKGTAGRLWKRTPFGWAVPPALSQVAGSGELDVPLNDIVVTTLPATTPPGIEFWMVGNDGRVYHFPE